MDIAKQRNFLLTEITINNPANNLKKHLEYEIIQDEDEIILVTDDGDYVGYLDDNKITFSVVYDNETLEDEGYNEFNNDNWVDILGQDHTFVKLAKYADGEIEAIDDYVSVTLDFIKLK